MKRKFIFSVTDSESAGKPIISIESVSIKVRNDQKTAESIISRWCHFNIPDEKNIKNDLEDIAYNMRHDGYAWFNGRWCFELTELNDDEEDN